MRPAPQPALERLVLACLAKNPDDRIQSAQDVKLQLEWLRGDASSSGSVPVVPSKGRWRIAGWVVAALLSAVLVTAFLVERQSASGGSSTGAMEFQRRTYRSQAIFSARFLRDAKTLVLSAALTGNRPRLYVLRADSPEPQPIGPEDVHLLAVSSRGELAVLSHARFTGHHRLFEGTLSRMPLEGAAPRELMTGVREADWSPDGENLAVIHEVAGKDRLEYPVGTVRYESAGYLSDVRVSPQGDAIAFMEHPSRWDDRGSVNVVDLHGPARVLADGYSVLEGLAWSASGQSLLFSATINGSEYVVQEVDRSGRLKPKSRNVGLVVIHDIAPDGTWAVTRDEIPTRLMFRAAGANADVDLSWLDSALQPSLSGDGKTLSLTDQSILAGANYSAIVRSTAGGPIVRLGEGVAEELSPNGKSVVAIVPSSPPRIMSYPLGAGTATRLDQGGFENLSCVRWMPDGDRLLVCGNEAGKPTQSFLVDPASKHTMPVGPEGAWEVSPAPDGNRFAVRSQDGWLICRLSGMPRTQPIPAITPVDELIRWSPDGMAVFCFPRGDVPSKVDRIDLASGRRTTVAVVGDRDQAGLVSVLAVTMADDQKTLVYGTWYYTSTLYTIDFSP
jgi:Tol biopolymer transport system component